MSMTLRNGDTLKPWDGTTPKSFLRYPVSKDLPLYEDSEGSIWYRMDDEWAVWCPAVRLVYHLSRLQSLLHPKEQEQGEEQ